MPETVELVRDEGAPIGTLRVVGGIHNGKCVIETEDLRRCGIINELQAACLNRIRLAAENSNGKEILREIERLNQWVAEFVEATTHEQMDEIADRLERI